MEIDETDKKIIGELVNNSRRSYREIAKNIGVSTATVMNRVNSLEKNKIIRKYTAKINYEKVGYDIEVMVQIRISKGKLFEVEKKISVLPNVFAVYDITGDFDAVVFSRFRNRRQMDAFLKKIQTFDFVERTETRLVLNTIKEEEVGVDGL